MPHRATHSAQVAAYIDPRLHQRMKRIHKREPRHTISRQIEYCLSRGLLNLEIELGMATKAQLKKRAASIAQAPETVS